MSDDAPERARPKPAHGAGRRQGRRLARRLGRLLLLALGPIVLVAAGGTYYVTSGRFVTTENAYVKMDKIAISADVSGPVRYVGVRENQIVEPGQILFQLDPERSRIALARKEAEFESARREVEALRADYRQKAAELEVARHDVA